MGLGERFEDPVPALLTPEFVKAFDGFVRPELRVVLKRPPGRRLEDSFYASVADAYRDAVSRGLNPRKIISEDAGVSTDVAGRWIYEARKRKHLAPGAPGKVTT